MLSMSRVRKNALALAAAREEWFALSEDDWRDAFSHHPRIGDLDALHGRFAATRDLSQREQSGVREAGDEVLGALAEDATTRFTTEQENSIRTLQTDTTKRINELRVARKEKEQLFEEGAPELKVIDAQIKSYEDSIDTAIGSFRPAG